MSFLLARIMIDAEVHRVLIRRFLGGKNTSLSAFITAIMGASFFLSLFFSNTIVVLSMIPVIKIILEGIPDKATRKRISTHIILALIYGANTGGMGSLTGSPLNVVYIGFIEFYGLPGRENITFFSWMVLGIPAALVMVIIGRMVLKWGEPAIELERQTQEKEPVMPEKRFYMFLGVFGVNLLIILVLTAVQFLEKPAPVWGGMNAIDITLVVYGILFLFFAFIFPRDKQQAAWFGKNLVHLLMFVILFAPIYLLETIKAVFKKFFRRGLVWAKRWDDFVFKIFSGAWEFLFSEKPRSLKEKNRFAFVSLNRMFYDLPFFGLLFMGAVLGVVYFLLRLGDNPATPGADGYVFRFIQSLSGEIMPHLNFSILFLLVIVLVSIFLTEMVTNTLVVLVMFPLVFEVSGVAGVDPLIAMLAVTIGASGAFMTPIATTVNAIAFASLEGVSLKKMLKLGFLMNVLGALWVTLLFYFMNMLTH